MPDEVIKPLSEYMADLGRVGGRRSRPVNRRRVDLACWKCRGSPRESCPICGGMGRLRAVSVTAAARRTGLTRQTIMRRLDKADPVKAAAHRERIAQARRLRAARTCPRCGRRMSVVVSELEREVALKCFRGGCADLPSRELNGLEEEEEKQL